MNLNLSAPLFQHQTDSGKIVNVHQVTDPQKGHDKFVALNETSNSVESYMEVPTGLRPAEVIVSLHSQLDKIK